MSKHHLILKLPGFTIEQISSYQPYSYSRLPRCAHCHSQAIDSYAVSISNEIQKSSWINIGQLKY